MKRLKEGADEQCHAGGLWLYKAIGRKALQDDRHIPWVRKVNLAGCVGCVRAVGGKLRREL